MGCYVYAMSTLDRVLLFATGRFFYCVFSTTKLYRRAN